MLLCLRVLMSKTTVPPAPPRSPLPAAVNRCGCRWSCPTGPVSRSGADSSRSIPSASSRPSSAFCISSRYSDMPAMLMTMGLALMITCQALISMLVAVGLGPVTGQPLPLISKGGTSTIINCAYIGAILSVSRSAKMKKEENIG